MTNNSYIFLSNDRKLEYFIIKGLNNEMIISLYKDIYQLVISLTSDKTTLCSILLTCKTFNFIGYKCLRNFNIDDITFWACKNGNPSLLKKLLEISKIKSFGK
jgi:hypothetical protein